MDWFRPRKFSVASLAVRRGRNRGKAELDGQFGRKEVYISAFALQKR